MTVRESRSVKGPVRRQLWKACSVNKALGVSPVCEDLVDHWCHLEPVQNLVGY